MTGPVDGNVYAGRARAGANRDRGGQWDDSLAGARAGWAAVVLAVAGVGGSAVVGVSSPASASPTTFYVAVGGATAGTVSRRPPPVPPSTTP